MSAQAIVHDTFVIETSIEAPPADVFAAYADVRAREAWAAPGGDVLVYDNADFRVGGADVFRCGPKADLKFHGSLWYHDIVENERIVYVELVRLDDQKLSLGLVTLELLAEKDGTRLLSTTQLTSFVGPQMIADSKSGTRAALHNLAAWCSRATSRR
jgi:uncharacterized protein YndB with AHSA1/START domain